MLKNLNRAGEWLNLLKVGLSSAIESFEEYAAAVTVGEAEALLFVEDSEDAITSPEDISLLHFTMFRYVHPWAGKFSQIGEDTWIGGMLSCDPRFIEQELRLLEKEVCELIRLGTKEAYVRAMAFFHAKFERLHPFKDGNGRVGRLILESQMNAWFGFNPVRGQFHPREYHSALADAQRKSNLRPLMNVILKVNGMAPFPKGFDGLPFRLSPYQGDMRNAQQLRERITRRKLAKNR